jgi:hypothetical protein
MKNSSQRILALAFGLVLLISSSFPRAAQASSLERQLLPRSLPIKAAHTEIMEWQSRETIVVKFVEGSFFRLRDGELKSSAAENVAAIAEVLDTHPVQIIERLFTQAEEDIEAEKSILETASGEQMPDLNLWYRMRIAEGTDPEALIDALNDLPEVEIAYPAPLPAPPPSMNLSVKLAVPVSSPNFEAQQGHLSAAPGGIEAKFAWPLAGGKGQNVNIVDIEYSFNASHEDLPSVPLIGGQMYNEFGDDHGTAVLGELVAMKNGNGVTGIAFSSKAKFASACLNSTDCDYNPANAISIAHTNTNPGDVIVIEQQTWVCGTSDYGPLEWLPDVYDAIKVATAASRIVVEAAGNGNNVDQGVNLDGAACAEYFNRDVRDSGAIIVGAGAPPTAGFPQTDRSRLNFSSYGSRVDLQGWGRWVLTTGYGDLHAGNGKNEWYTETFSGTSSATPIVAGAAAILSSISQARGKVQTPAWIRSTLVSTGSPQQSHPGFPVSQHIGPRPDLEKAIAKLERPTPISPSGTIPDKTPTFKWSSVFGATQYRFQVLQGTATVYTKTVSSGACNSATCANTPTNVLSNASYKWHVQAIVGGDWKAYSAFKNFTVSTSAPNFNSSFNGSSNGWSGVNSVWSVYNSQYYRSTGQPNGLNSAKHTGTYSNFTYEVRMKRTGVCTKCANNIIIRGKPTQLIVEGWWNPSYVFEYANSGSFSVRKFRPNGTYVALKPWTSSSAIIKKGWNTLKVAVVGTSLKFYINGKLVWSGKDTTLKSGQVGFGFFRYVDAGTLLVDWAKLTKTSSSALTLDEEVMPGVELHGGDVNQSRFISTSEYP